MVEEKPLYLLCSKDAELDSSKKAVFQANHIVSVVQAYRLLVRFIFKVIGGGAVFKYMIELSETEQPHFTEFKKLAPLSKYRASTNAKIAVFYS